MKLQVLQENFSKALGLSSRFTSTRAQLPVLGNILLSAKKAKLLIAATNLETAVSISIGAKVEREGEITVPARIISELVSNLKTGAIDIGVEKEQLKIESQGFNSTILGMNSADFPSIPSGLDKKTAISLPTEKFLSSLSQVLYAASIDETRPILTGVLFVVEKGRIILVATDGFRLSKKEVEIRGPAKPFKIILTKGILVELSRLSGEGEEIFFCHNEKENQVIFAAGDVVLSSRIIEGEFPDFEKIIPKSHLYKACTDKEELLRAVKLASVFARDGANIVKLSLAKDALEVSAESANSGSQKTKVDVKTEKDSGSGLQIAFNYRFLEEFLQSIIGDEVSMEFSSDASPGVFTDTKDASLLYLIMPVRIQS